MHNGEVRVSSDRKADSSGCLAAGLLLVAVALAFVLLVASFDSDDLNCQGGHGSVVKINAGSGFGCLPEEKPWDGLPFPLQQQK